MSMPVKEPSRPSPSPSSLPSWARQNLQLRPLVRKIPENLRHHVLGAQCNMWTEYADTPDYTEYLLYPRMLALAELD